LGAELADLSLELIDFFCSVWMTAGYECNEEKDEG